MCLLSTFIFKVYLHAREPLTFDALISVQVVFFTYVYGARANVAHIGAPDKIRRVSYRSSNWAAEADLLYTHAPL